MGLEKFLIILALIILLSAFIFRKKIAEEVQLHRQSVVKESVALIYFYPLSQKERTKALTAYIEEMKVIQQKISKTIFTKYFVDFTPSILEREKELEEGKIEAFFAADALSFITANYHRVTAHPQFAKEPLLKVGFLIDEAFPEKESTDAIYAIDIENDRIIVNIYDLQSADETEKSRYKEFVNQVSKEAFDDDPVSLHVMIPGSERKLVFNSEDSDSTLGFFYAKKIKVETEKSARGKIHQHR